MAQAKSEKLYRTFVRGLVTEASPLTYPEDSSLDERNTVPSRKGNRTRRYGMNYNPSNTTPRTYDPTRAKAEFVWTAVANVPALTFLVVQNDNQLTFYDRSQQAFAANIKGFSVDLNAYSRPGISSVGASNCKFAAGRGLLFVVNPDSEPLVVTYDQPSDTISVTKVVIQMRDFEGLYDGLANDTEPTTLGLNHFYNLLNQGWVAT